jgi:hypothetical protein
MKAALSIVPGGKPAPVAPTYATDNATARILFADLAAKVRRIETALSGSFSTTVKMAQAERELGEISALALSTQRSIRSGR